MSENYETLPFVDARSFLDALRRSNPRWLHRGASLTPWVFRGQGNADWQLVPSAWRATIPQSSYCKRILAGIDQKHAQKVIDHHHRLPTDLQIDIERVRHQIAQRRYEFLQVNAFVSLADELGMNVPGGFLSNHIPIDFVPHDSSWQHPHPAYALAQHHGMATRLIDWTQNPLYAAFFAAEEPYEDCLEMAVWALDTMYLRTQLHWRELRVPRSQIGFLHAQAGLFTYNYCADHHFVLEGKWPLIEDIATSDALKKLTLRRSEAGELRRLLFAEGISRAHLMPTLDNVRHTLDSLWEEAATDSLVSDAVNYEKGKE
ncbi:MAG: FRG domain-containing protein [Pirellula sp.]|jgi:hypothetical protein|nr:FRG domain-containing protein [Pirellula sp.]